MKEIPAPLAYLLVTWGVVTGLLVIMVIYRATLSSREDDQIFLNKAEDNMMASEQRVVIDRNRTSSRGPSSLSLRFRECCFWQASACGFGVASAAF